MIKKLSGKGGKASKKDGGGGGEVAQQQLSPEQQEKLRQAMEMLSMQNQVRRDNMRESITTNKEEQHQLRKIRSKSQKLQMPSSECSKE